jgi:hypothetical protein
VGEDHGHQKQKSEVRSQKSVIRSPKSDQHSQSTVRTSGPSDFGLRTSDYQIKEGPDVVRSFWCEMLGGQEALRRSLSLSLRRSLRRSLASRPPHTPAAWLVLRAYWRQASIAGHSAQISLAREAAGGSSEAGKNMSLETPLQAASFRQSTSGSHVTSVKVSNCPASLRASLYNAHGARDNS